jgi:hypothetical protein
MSLRTTLAALLVTLTALAGCASSTPAAEGAGLTAAESARLAALSERLRAINATPDSTLSPAEAEETLAEVRSLRDKQEAASRSEPTVSAEDAGSKWTRGSTIVLAGVAVVVAAVLLINTWEFDYHPFGGGGGDE